MELPVLGDAHYFRHRAVQQTEAANQARDSKARAIHLELALRYELLANAASAQGDATAQPS